MVSVVISAGHALYVRGASGILDEVDEARRIVSRLIPELTARGVNAIGYWDDVSTTQNENLERIVDFHNSQDPHDLDISVHLNAFEQCSAPRGCEVLYVSTKNFAAKMSAAIADCGFIDRGAKYNSDLFFLNQTIAPAILIEVCFVDSEADAQIYGSHFDLICENIADAIGGETVIETDPEALFEATGKCSFFGGPEDEGVDADEGLAFIYKVEDAPQLFLPYQPEGTTGLARRLNPFTHFVACRWDYSITPKEHLLQDVALVRAKKTGIELRAFAADWGPADSTGRVADLSPSLMMDLGIETDDEVHVIFPYREG